MERVFVSFTGADVVWAEWIAAVVKDAGYHVRFQRWDFGVGSNFVAEMSAALEDAGRLVMVASERYWSSVMATAEWTAAFARDPASLVPIRIEDVAPPALLAPIAYVDVFDVAEADARARIVEALRGPGRLLGPVRFPGGVRWPSAPAVFEAPRRPAPLAGRDEVLAELRERLAGADAVTLTQALAGPGGVGKTVLAAEYAWRYRSDYALVWWVESEQRPLILDSYVRLAPRLGVTVPDDLEALPRLVHQALDGFAGQWLLVFDNAPDYGAVAPFLPPGDGHVLIHQPQPRLGRHSGNHRRGLPGPGHRRAVSARQGLWR
ncbi:MAG: TIR domain-containing protein [Egibacteraceae bacterium]